MSRKLINEESFSDSGKLELVRNVLEQCDSEKLLTKGNAVILDKTEEKVTG